MRRRCREVGRLPTHVHLLSLAVAVQVTRERVGRLQWELALREGALDAASPAWFNCRMSQTPGRSDLEGTRRPTGNPEYDFQTLVALVDDVVSGEDWGQTDDGKPGPRRDLMSFLEQVRS